MHRLRTPDERFADVPEFACPPRYVDVPAGDGEPLRMHYVDVGPRDGAVVLLLHGEPTWSFLYRHQIAALAAAGLRAVAPDLIGFGRSDKPTATGDYTYQRHIDWLRAFLAATGIDELSLVCQDWGGLLGLRLAGETPDIFRKIVAMNTFLPTGEQELPAAFHRWREFSQKVPDLPVGGVVQGGAAQPLAPAVVAAYDAPFPDASYKAGARVFPTLVPISPDDPACAANKRAWDGLRRYARPFLTVFGARDPITAPAQARLQAEVPGARDQPHRVFERAGHFLQEDLGSELGDVLARFLRD